MVALWVSLDNIHSGSGATKPSFCAECAWLGWRNYKPSCLWFPHFLFLQSLIHRLRASRYAWYSYSDFGIWLLLFSVHPLLFIIFKISYIMNSIFGRFLNFQLKDRSGARTSWAQFNLACVMVLLFLESSSVVKTLR